jgi:hypothetical protein
MSNVMENIWKEGVVAVFVLSLRLPGETEENH